MAPPRAVIFYLVSVAIFGGCECAAPPGAQAELPLLVSVGSGAGEPVGNDLIPGEPTKNTAWGTVADNLPFAPNKEKLASIAWRTWIYTDVGPQRTRLGYLRVGAIVDARGPLIKNPGCAGGWLRINPRGFVCLGKGATQDLEHKIVRQSQKRAQRGKGFPYTYARSRERAPERYFRLPSRDQLTEIEGKRVHERAANWRQRAKVQGLFTRLELDETLPAFMENETTPLEKPYGVSTYLRRQVHAGQTSAASGFALVDMFLWQGRAYGLSTEMDFFALDRLRLVEESSLQGLILNDENVLPVAFHVRGGMTLWKQTERGGFLPKSEQREKKGFLLTGNRATGGMIETQENGWLVQSTIRLIEPREGYPSMATGRRKWIDISIKNQTLVAYEGKKAVYATLISGGRGGIGKKGESNPEGHRTVRGTFMIHEKSISSTMDGDEDKADSYDLQDVPFVQYFHRGFALHGAYWHDDFGRKRSHGCVNLAPRDSAWLFEWSDPPVPPGWHAALNKKRGTVVYIHP